MGNINVDRNVYQAVTRATRDGQVSANEMQNIRTEMEASGGINANEQQVLNRLESRTAFTVASGGAQTPIDPSQLRFPSSGAAASRTGQNLGTRSGSPANVGQHHGTFNTEREAMVAARGMWGMVDDPDLAIIQSPDGKYQLHSVAIPGSIRSDSDDFSSYSEMRSARLQRALPDGSRVVNIISEDNEARYLQGESSPRTYGRPADMPPLTPASASSATRSARIDELRASTGETLNRLRQMERDLGSQRDHRGIFSAMYRVITERGISDMERLAQQGDLRGAEFTGTLINRFANRYFDAYDAYSRGDMANVPEVWRSAFDSGRNAEAGGYPGASVTEVVGLSMVAHIINDLPQTLQDMGYPSATDRAALTTTFDGFNQALMEEKGRIMGAIGTHYGVTDTHVLDRLGSAVLGSLGAPIIPPSMRRGEAASGALQREAFTIMRTMARDRAISMTPTDIRRSALGISDNVRLLPGGN